MFLEIDDVSYNKLYIQSVSTNDTETYDIVYQLSNGSKIEEHFNSSSDRDARLQEVLGGDN